MIAAIIQARMESTRLPGKVMMDICGKPVLWHVVSRVSQSACIDKIIVATSTEHYDNVIKDFCDTEKIPVFRGSKNDVLDRYYQCALQFKTDVIVRITADCPLHDANVIDRVIHEFNKGGYDYVTNTIEYTYPDGLDVEVFSINVLESAWKNANLDSEREHVTPYISNNPTTKSKNVAAVTKYPLYRLTLDTPEDYNFIIKIFEGLNNYSFGLDDVVAYLKNNPDLLKINQHIGRNEGYLKSLVQDAKKTILQTNRIFLRELTPEDATDCYCQWLNDPVVNRFMETKSAHINEIKKFISEKQVSPECVLFGIFLKKNKQHIGNIKIEPIEFNRWEAVIGILIGDKQIWGKGICSEAIRAVVKYAFSVMNLHKISLGVISENIAAINCYKKAGFIIEEVTPYTGVNSASFQNSVLMSIYNLKNQTDDKQ